MELKAYLALISGKKRLKDPCQKIPLKMNTVFVPVD
jgi:hypothetical protein